MTLDALRELDPKFVDMVEVNENGCWDWCGRRTPDGYGLVKRRKRSSSPMRAHRYAWELAHGRRMRSDMIGLHTCDRPSCVNPAHIQERTQRTNLLDMYRKGRRRNRNWRVILNIETGEASAERV